MRKNLIYGLLGIVAGMILMSLAKLEFNPLSNQLVNSVLWYQKSDEMKAIYLQNFNIAKSIVEMQALKNQNQKNLAVVVDIDETMLDNSPFEGMLIHRNKSFNSSLWNDWVSKEAAKALPGAVEFTQFAKSMNVEIFYISNRSINTLEHTIRNLQKQGFAYADSSHVLLKTNTSDKTQRREQVKSLYKVILYIGDNMGDFGQEYSKIAKEYDSLSIHRNKQLWGSYYIVMPNPMYGIWEHSLFPQRKNLVVWTRQL